MSDMNNDFIKEKVKSIIEKYKTRDPYELVKALDVILVYVSLVDLNGFYQYAESNHIIYINNQLDDDKQKYVLAHELAHLFLHKNINYFRLTEKEHNKIEYEANTFANELLINDIKF